jgi:hypothetical protein
VGSALKAVAKEGADISTLNLEPMESWSDVEIFPSSPRHHFPISNGQLSQVPRPITPRPPEKPTPTLPPRREEPLEPTPPTPPIPETRPNIPGTITVKRFEFVGNTAFSNEELAEVIKPFTGKPITFADLLQVEAAVSRKYTNAGYINSGAVIPADQTLAPEGAVVKIQKRWKVFYNWLHLLILELGGIVQEERLQVPILC